jgi:oligopeptide/dipeptide ABC transporter ATP-binding protein
MYLGKIVELAEKPELFANPLHPYTRGLLASIPVPDPGKKIERAPIGGDLPSPAAPPPGCAFHTRCPEVEDICRHEAPQLREVTPAHFCSCHFRNP